MGDTAVVLNTILFLLGIYLSLKLFDKTFVQGKPLGSDVSGLVMLAGYLVIAPALFHASIAPAHRYMTRARRRFLKPTEARFADGMKKIGAPGGETSDATAARDLLSIDQALALLRKKIPVWPFHFRYSPSLSIAMPVLSIVVSLLLVSIKNIVLILRAIFLFDQTM